MNKKKSTYNNLFIHKSQQFLSLIKQTEKINKKEIDNSWKEVEKQLYAKTSSQKKSTFTRTIFWISYSATAIVCIFLSLNIYNNHFKNNHTLSTQLLDNMTTIERIDDICLMTPQTHIKLKDKSILHYSTDGSLTIPREQIKDSIHDDIHHSKIQLNQIIVPKGKRTEIIFSDGTKAYINAGSRVIYPRIFDKNKREIVIEGEVYLEVAPNPKSPFIVKSSNSDIKVLGTAFNVSAYKEDKAGSVVLVHGKVEIETTQKEKIVLQPDQLAYITPEKTTTQNVNVLKYTSWKDNLLFLDSDKTSDVLNQLSRFYGVNINYATEVADIPISGKLDLRKDIEGVLKNIEESLSLECKGNKETGFYLFIGK